jgi:hypothetical protein
MKLMTQNSASGSFEKIFRQYCSYNGAKDQDELESRMMEVLRTISRDTNKIVDL